MQQSNLPKVAVVILSWNGRKFLEQFLPSVVATTYANADIYVADNFSTDDSVAFVKEHFPTVNVIALPENYGFPGGYNVALREVKADYYVLLNQDVEVTPGWIEPVIALMLSKPDCGAAQPKLRAFLNKKEFEYAGGAGGYMDAFGYPFCKGRLFDVMEEDQGQYDAPAEIFWASGAAMFIKANLYHELGGLDEYFFAHMEEIDLCWRLKNAGYSIWYCPDSIVYHVGGGSLPQGNPKKTYLNFRNNLILLYKNLPVGKVWPILIARFFLDFAALLRSLVSGNSADAAAISRAHRHFVSNLSWFRKRRIADDANLRKLSIGAQNQKGTYKGSIVWQFFAAGKKKFSELAVNKFI